MYFDHHSLFTRCVLEWEERCRRRPTDVEAASSEVEEASDKPSDKCSASLKDSFSDIEGSSLEEDDESVILYGSYGRQFLEMFKTVSGTPPTLEAVCDAMQQGTKKSTRDMFARCTEEDIKGLKGEELDVGRWVMDQGAPVLFLFVHLMLERTFGRVVPSSWK